MRSEHRTAHGVRTLAFLVVLAIMTSCSTLPAFGAPPRADVSLARGWVHRPAVAPGLVLTGAYNDVHLVAGGPGLVAYVVTEQQGGSIRLYASTTGRDWK